MTKSTTIYNHENGSTETWIYVNDDGTVTRESEKSGWAIARGGLDKRTETLPAEQAKKLWSHSDAIDHAFSEFAVKRE